MDKEDDGATPCCDKDSTISSLSLSRTSRGENEERGRGVLIGDENASEIT